MVILCHARKGGNIFDVIPHLAFDCWRIAHILRFELPDVKSNHAVMDWFNHEVLLFSRPYTCTFGQHVSNAYSIIPAWMRWKDYNLVTLIVDNLDPNMEKCPEKTIQFLRTLLDDALAHRNFNVVVPCTNPEHARIILDRCRGGAAYTLLYEKPRISANSNMVCDESDRMHMGKFKDALADYWEFR